MSYCSHHSGMQEQFPQLESTMSRPAIGAEDRACRQPAGHFPPLIDRNRCEGKGPCVEACPFGVLSMGVLDAQSRSSLSIKGRIKAWVHGGRQAFPTSPDLCAACGDCVRVCPEQAITLARRTHPGTAAPVSAAQVEVSLDKGFRHESAIGKPMPPSRDSTTSTAWSICPSIATRSMSHCTRPARSPGWRMSLPCCACPGVVGGEVALLFGGSIRLRDGGSDHPPKAGPGLQC